MSLKKSVTSVDEVLSALADPTRRALFEATLRTPGLTTSQLSDRIPAMTRWGVIKHMAVLREAGLIQTMATGRLRRHYAESGALNPLGQWLDAIRDR